MKALLDTHVLNWWLNDRTRLSPAQQKILGSVCPEMPLLVSDISLWEVATLHRLGRIRLALPLRVQRHGISPAIAAEVAALPDSFHRGPADRILVATARVLGAMLLTQDRRIVDAALADTSS